MDFQRPLACCQYLVEATSLGEIEVTGFTFFARSDTPVLLVLVPEVKAGFVDQGLVTPLSKRKMGEARVCYVSLKP